MHIARRLLQSVLVLISVLATVGMAAAQNPSEVLTIIDGEKITRGELETKEKGRLLQPRYEFYVAETRALDDLIEQKLLEAEARRQKMTVDQLLDKEVKSKVQDPTDDQMKVFYEGLNTQQPYDAVRGKILEHIHDARVTKARAAYVQSLRDKASVLITLAPPRADFALGDAPRLGPENAPIQLVEFADYECPYCVKVFPEVKKLRAEYGDKISFYFKDLPLPMHSHARKAAEAARCAGDQKKYWEYHEKLFTSGNQLEVPQLKKLAAEMGMDSARFDKCLDSSEQAAAVQKDFTEATGIGISATPAFFMNGHFFTGAVDVKELRQMVERELATKKLAAANEPGK
jgi:protein-disulfide isomerase